MTAHQQDTEPLKKKSSSFLKNLGVLVISTVAALTVGELTVRLFVPVRNVGPTFSEYDPVYGKRLKKSFSCTRTAAEFTMQFSTNSLGFRGPEPEAFPAHGILFLGDSFTSGYGVDDGQEFPDLIRQTLARDFPESAPSVVNAGSGNTGNGYWLRFLRNEAERFAPRIVVLGFCINDFDDNYFDGMFVLDSEGRIRENTESHRQEAARDIQAVIEAIPGLAYSHLVGLARQVFSEGWAEGTLPAVSPTRDSLTYALVSNVLSTCRDLDLPTFLLTIEVDGNRKARLDSLAHAFNVPLITTPTKRERPDLYYATDGHWNARGHREVAQRVYDALRPHIRN